MTFRCPLVSQVELMTPRTNRLQLLPPQQVSQVDAGGSVERAFSHEVVETADHTLIVSVSYNHASGEESLITKPVALPVSVSSPESDVLNVPDSMAWLCRGSSSS